MSQNLEQIFEGTEYEWLQNLDHIYTHTFYPKNALSVWQPVREVWNLADGPGRTELDEVQTKPFNHSFPVMLLRRENIFRVGDCPTARIALLGQVNLPKGVPGDAGVSPNFQVIPSSHGNLYIFDGTGKRLIQQINPGLIVLRLPHFVSGKLRVSCQDVYWQTQDKERWFKSKVSI